MDRGFRLVKQDPTINAEEVIAHFKKMLTSHLRDQPTAATTHRGISTQEL